MKMSKRLTAALLSVLAMIILLPVQALAAGSIELGRDVSLTISCQYGNTSLVGAQFDIYLVATVDQYGELTPTDTFAQFNVNIRGQNDAAWGTLASTLESYVLRDGIAPTDSGKTGDQGLVSFPNQQNNLTPGLYLVLGQRYTQGGYRYDTTPFMVLLPGLDQEANDWNYDVTVNPKYEKSPVPEVPSTVTRKVLKVWKDEGHENERPQEVVVQLLRDGEIYDTVTLNAGNNWRYTWTDLNDSYRWTVAEKELDNYAVELTQEGITFVVTNKYAEDIPGEPTQTPPPTEPGTPAEPGTPIEPGTPTEPDTPIEPVEPDTPTEPNLPQTGQLWWPAPVLIAAGLLLVVIGFIRRRGVSDEK